MNAIVIEVAVPSVEVATAADVVEVVDDPDGPAVILVPTPGPPSPLSPEELDALADEIADAVAADLEPPVNLVLWFENQLA